MKISGICLRNLWLTVLLFGLISLVAGGGWLLYVRYAMIERGMLTYDAVYMAGLKELVYSMLFHFAVAAILALDEKKRKEDTTS